MKKTDRLLFILICILAAGCQGSHRTGKDTQRTHVSLLPGTVIAKDSMPVKEDKLNNFTFGITVSADSDVANGVYNIKVNYEYHTEQGQFTMPEEIKNVRPLLRRADQPYTYIIGFKITGDTTFYDYYQVKATSSSIRMEYIKGYTF